MDLSTTVPILLSADVQVWQSNNKENTFVQGKTEVDGTFYLSPSFIEKGLINFICSHYYQQSLMLIVQPCPESHHNEEVAVWTICAG